MKEELKVGDLVTWNETYQKHLFRRSCMFLIIDVSGDATAPDFELTLLNQADGTTFSSFAGVFRKLNK